MTRSGPPQSWHRRRLTRAAAAAGVMTVAMLSWAGPASAHAYFVDSNPPDGAALTLAPRTVELDFSSNVDSRLARVQLTDGAAHRLPVPGLEADPTRPTRLDVQLPALPPEAYRLTF